MSKTIRLVSAEYHGYVGFIVSNIKTIKVTFVEVLQILNSTNGSGKSTFIAELNPKTINKEMFTKDGYKRNVYDVDGTLYELYSSHSTNTFTNLSTGENLNDSGTITQHNTLLRTVFGVSPYLWDIAMGKTLFSHQDANSRRRWIETLSGENLDFVFTLYDKVTKLITGIKHTLKVFQADLVSAQEKILSETEMDKLGDDRRELERLLDVLMSHGAVRSDGDQTELRNLMAEIAKVQAVAKETNAKLKAGWGRKDAPEGITTVDELSGYLTTLSHEHDLLVTKQTHLYDKLANAEYAMERLASMGNVSEAVLVSRISEVDKKVAIHTEHREKLATAHGFGVPGITGGYIPMKDAVDSFIEAIQEHNSITESDWVYPFPAETFDRLRDDLQHATREIAVVKARQEDITGHVADIKAGKEITCPSCKHHFQDGVSEITTLRQRWSTLEKEAVLLQELIEERTQQVESYQAVVATREYVSGLYHDVIGSLQGKWHVPNLVDFTIAPSLQDSIMYLSAYVDFLKVCDTIDALELRKAAMGEDLRIVKAVSAANSEGLSLEETADKLRKELSAVTEQMGQTVVKKQDAARLLGSVNKQLELARTQYRTLSHLKKLKERIQVVSNKYVGSRVYADIQRHLARIMESINTNDSYVTLVADLKVRLGEMERRVMALTMIQTHLSPTKGLIAEQLTDHCDHFAEGTNQVLRQIWNYDMAIAPAPLVRGKHTYNFILTYDGKRKGGDIAAGSLSQRRIVDMGIMFYSRLLLGLDRLPLFFDEVSVGLDDVHARNIRYFIKNLIPQQEGSNLLFVDHNCESRNMLGVHDEVVFDNRHVITGAEYNKHVDITYYAAGEAP